MHREFFVAAGGWDPIDMLGIQFYDCKLIRDVPGLGSEGDIFGCLSVEWDEGVLKAYDDHGNVTHEVKLKLKVEVDDANETTPE